MKISVISSSTRAGRASHRVALLLKKQIETVSGHHVSLIDLSENELSVFEERIKFLKEIPKHILLISQELKSSDGIIFVTPEYNGGISPGLKQLIDIFGQEEYAGKPIGVATASTGSMGGIRAALQLQQIILAIQAYPQPQMLLVPNVSSTLDETGDIADPKFASKVKHFLNSFLAFSRQLSADKI
jgi:NAD(P)H-dependent FMN reductase